MKHIKAVFVFLVVLLMGSTAYGQVRYDSHSLDPAYIRAGDDVELYVKFHEGMTQRVLYSSPSDAQGVRVPIPGDRKVYYISRIRPKDTITASSILIKRDSRNIGNVFPGETWSSGFSFHVLDNAPATDYTLVFEILKTNMEMTAAPEIVLSQDIQVRVSGQPKFTFNSDSELDAGAKRTFRVTVINNGGGVARESIVSLNATHPITVLKSSSTSLGDMKPRESKTISYDVFVDSKAEPKAYIIPLRVSYLDRSGNLRVVEEKLGVRVMGAPVIDVSLDSVEELVAGKSATATLRVVNKGFMDAKFLSIDVEDTDQYSVVSGKSTYIGNLGSDDFETEDIKIRIGDDVSGEISFKGRITYTQENNNQRTEEDFEFSMNVLSRGDYDLLNPSANASEQILGLLLLIPALIAGYLGLWLLFKIVGALTGFVDRKIFRKL
jgi:hypothetical protein